MSQEPKTMEQLREDLMKTEKKVDVIPETEKAPIEAKPGRVVQRMAFKGVLEFHEQEYQAKDRKAARRRRRQLIARFIDVVGEGEVANRINQKSNIKNKKHKSKFKNI